MRPEVLAATAESSPSIRPLTAITPAGVPEPAKHIFHTPNAARPVSTRAAAIITRKRSRRVGSGAFAAALELSTAIAVWPFGVAFFGSIAIWLMTGSPFRSPADWDRGRAG